MSPSSFACPATILPEIVSVETATELARHLAPVHEAQDGALVALNLTFSDAFGGPYRYGVTMFLIRDGDEVVHRAYSELSVDQQPVAAHLELVLQADDAFGDAVAGEFPEMRDSDEDATYYSIYVVTGAVGIVNLEACPELSGRSQEDLNSFCRLLLPLASSSHEAIARHEDLVHMMKFWRSVLTYYAKAHLPKMIDPSVTQLLAPSDIT